MDSRSSLLTNRRCVSRVNFTRFDQLSSSDDSLPLPLPLESSSPILNENDNEIETSLQRLFDFSLSKSNRPNLSLISILRDYHYRPLYLALAFVVSILVVTYLLREIYLHRNKETVVVLDEWRPIETCDDLTDSLEAAVLIERTLVEVYSIAFWSACETLGSDSHIAHKLREILYDEIIRIAHLGNFLNSLSRPPDFISPASRVRILVSESMFRVHLPWGIGDFEIRSNGESIFEQVIRIGIMIEMPLNDVDLENVPEEVKVFLRDNSRLHSVSDFYEMIRKFLSFARLRPEISEGISFLGTTKNSQVTGYLPDFSPVRPITNLTSAHQFIASIRNQHDHDRISHQLQHRTPFHLLVSCFTGLEPPKRKGTYSWVRDGILQHEVLMMSQTSCEYEYEFEFDVKTTTRRLQELTDEVNEVFDGVFNFNNGRVGQHQGFGLEHLEDVLRRREREGIQLFKKGICPVV